MGPRPERVRGAPRHRVKVIVFSLLFIGVGVWLIVTTHSPTERLTAIMSASHLSYPNPAQKVSFLFEDGTTEEVVSPSAPGFFDAVAKLGPASGQVTRNADNHSIYTVKFRGKTYTLSSSGGDLTGGIVAVVLGLLGLIYVGLTSRGTQRRVGATRQRTEVAAASGVREHPQRADQPEPEPASDNQRLEQLLYRLADDIAADDANSSTTWSREVRKCAEWVGAGSPTGLTRFFEIFSPDPRNTINEQRFTRTRTYAKAERLASQLLKEHKAEMSRNAAEAASDLLPWREGSTGKALVYEDGTVVATEDRGGGLPYIADIKNLSRPNEEPQATLAIRPNGLCAVYDSSCDEAWLAARLHEYDPRLRLERKPRKFLASTPR